MVINIYRPIFPTAGNIKIVYDDFRNDIKNLLG
jgi:hypothetical protein